MRISEAADAVAVVAIAGGLGQRFGWWLAATTAGAFVLASNWVRSK